MWCFWLIAAGIFFVVEIVTVGFLIFWLGIGAICAMLVSFITSNILIQAIVFVISSIILIIFTKPLLNKYINKDTPLTNAYSVLGKQGVVVSDICGTNSIGQVKVNGEIWSAVPNEDDIAISKDTKVEVLKIDGVKLIVKSV